MIDESIINDISNFPLHPNMDNLNEYLRLIYSNWEYADSTWEYNRDTGCLRISTVGWSDNEEIISKIKDNYLFWGCFWYKSKRGGHYWFKLFQFDDTGKQCLPKDLDFVSCKGGFKDV